MNIRELMNKAKSPGGKTFIFITALVIGLICIIPYLQRKDDSLLKMDHSGKSKDIIEIPGNTKLFKVAKRDRKRTYPAKETPGVIDSNKIPAPPGKTLSKIPVHQRKQATSGKISPPYKRSSLNRYSRRSKVKLKKSIVIIDGETQNKEKKVFLSSRYAPMGRLISCKLVNSIESNNQGTPLIAIVTEDLWWTQQNGEKKLIIPAGTEVHGSVSGDAVRNRLMSSKQFVFIWQITSDMVGFELQLSGMALEKSHDPQIKSLATITDMSAGIPGRVIKNDDLSKMLMYTFAFTQGLAEGYQTTSVASNSSSTILAYEGTSKNAFSRGFANLSQTALQDITQQIAKESFFIRIAAGTEFYVYVTEVIDLGKAQIADTLLNQLEKKKKKDAKEKKPFSYSKILNKLSSKKY